MEDHFTYTKVAWLLLSGLSIILALSSMIFLTMYCLQCLFRRRSARIDDTELLLDLQLEQTMKSVISEPIIKSVIIPSMPGKPQRLQK